MNSKSKNRNPWPTKAVMQQVYTQNLWGENGTEFYSGEGSHDPELIEPYLAEVIRFLKSFEKYITICDLGCGDFNIGNQLIPYVERYIAIDIVPELIHYNARNFADSKVEFVCTDIAKDKLPKADCAILRQVLQHLSNIEIQQIVEKLPQYKYVLLTEHVPDGEYVPNKDIISGQGIRLKKQSGVDLLRPPFSLQVKGKTMLLSQSPIRHKGVIVTTLFQML
jgi:hypothetical protein